MILFSSTISLPISFFFILNEYLQRIVKSNFCPSLLEPKNRENKTKSINVCRIWPAKWAIDQIFFRKTLHKFESTVKILLNKFFWPFIKNTPNSKSFFDRSNSGSDRFFQNTINWFSSICWPCFQNPVWNFFWKI